MSISVEFRGTIASIVPSGGIDYSKKEADASGGSLILFNVNDSMREVFEIGGFRKGVHVPLKPR